MASDDEYYRSMGANFVSQDSINVDMFVNPTPDSSRSESPYYNQSNASSSALPSSPTSPAYEIPSTEQLSTGGSLPSKTKYQAIKDSTPRFAYFQPPYGMQPVQPSSHYQRPEQGPPRLAALPPKRGYEGPAYNGTPRNQDPLSGSPNIVISDYETPVPPLEDATHESESETNIDDIPLPTVNAPGVPPLPTKKQAAYERAKTRLEVYYGVEDSPPWYISFILAIQNFLIMYGATAAILITMAEPLCMKNNNQALAEVLSTIFVVSGIGTFLQASIGIRLPIVQGGSFSFVYPAKAILNDPFWKCNGTDPSLPAQLMGPTISPELLPEPEWKPRMREIQGAIMIASLFQVLIGVTGTMGFMMRYIGPLAICPTISLIGLSLFDVAVQFSQSQWWITLVTVILIIAFSQYSRNIEMPCFHFKKGEGCIKMKVPIFRLFPVILAIILTWIITIILTVTKVLPSPPGRPWALGGNDSKVLDILHHTPWINLPYPGQWGMPTVSAAAVFGMLAGVLASMVESVGDYYACARMAGVPPPPMHAVNRGIAVEGIACIIFGAFGSGNGTTSYSENIGAVGITKVASRTVIMVSAVVMVLLGVFAKVGVLFVAIPDPIVGGVFIVMFGMIAAVGMSNLQFVNLNSSRNLFILGFSFFFGLTLPKYLNDNPDVIQTGSSAADQIFSTLFRTSMFVGGFAGFILDNTIPGTDKERGLIKWREQLIRRKRGRSDSLTDGYVSTQSTYDLPYITGWLQKITCFRYIPFLPSFNEDYFTPRRSFRKKHKKKPRHRSNDSSNRSESEMNN